MEEGIDKMDNLLEMLDTTTQGLLETLKQSDLWRLLESENKNIDDYKHILCCLAPGQQKLETWLNNDSYWNELRLQNIKRIPVLHEDMKQLLCKFHPETVEPISLDRNRFLAALYVNELLRTYAYNFSWTMPQSWPNSFFDNSLIKYRWPEIRLVLKNYTAMRQDLLEICWYAQELFNDLIEDYGKNSELSDRLLNSTVHEIYKDTA